MKKKYLIIVATVLALIILAVWAVPALAASPSTVPAQSGHAAKAILARLLLIQDEAKVDKIIASAQTAGKITADQADKLKNFWTAYHKQFTQKFVLHRLLKASDCAKVQVFLDKGVAAGKITQAQADKVMALWNTLHSK